MGRFVKMVFFVLLFVGFGLFNIGGCGGDGNGERELTVFDVTIRVLEVESQNGPADCPENANLKLSLLINGNNISGFAELIEFGNIGDSTPISGIIEGNKFSLDFFAVGVQGCEVPFFSPEPEPICYLTFGFNTFEGIILDNDSDGDFDRMEGILAGSIFSLIEIQILCDSEFTGEFAGEEKIPSGCVSKAELTLDENRDCPAEAISNLCDGVSYLCEIPESMPPGDFPINNSCVAISCFTIDCPISPEITNLQLGINGGINGNFVTSEGIGEPISCFGPSGRL
jgi:hypothetical protein